MFQSLLSPLNAGFAGLALVVILALILFASFLVRNRGARLNEAQFRPPSAKILAVMALSSSLLLGGCVPGYGWSKGWRYSCTGTCSIPLEQAKSKCIAQGNAAYGASITSKRSIARSCLAGEGYTRHRCQVGQSGCTSALGDPLGY